MKVLSDGKTAVINDVLKVDESEGFIQLEVLGGGFLPFALKTKPDEYAVAADAPKTEYDNNFYQNGNNGLTLDESAEEAFHTIYNDIVPLNAPYAFGDIDHVREGVKTLIRNGGSRRDAYIVAGGVVRGYREGLYKGLPFAFVFKGFAQGEISETQSRNITQGQSSSYALRNV